MADRWTAPGGWVVDVIRLSLTGTGRDGTWLRIRRRGFWIADVRTVAEVEAFLPLASLEPDGLAPAELPLGTDSEPQLRYVASTGHLAACHLVHPGRHRARHQRRGARPPGGLAAAAGRHVGELSIRARSCCR